MEVNTKLWKLLVPVSKMTCHSEGVFVATEESHVFRSEILRFAQDDIFEMTCKKHDDENEFLDGNFSEG